MNEEIYFLYKDLPNIQQKHINELFDKSNKMKRLIQVIESKGRYFKTVYAVNYIYSEEIESTNFKVLTNRFYKLRQELKDWLLKQLKHSPVCFTDEEQELIYLKQLIINNEYTQASEKLEVLENKCWENNLFEILHQVIELQLRCIQSSYKRNPTLEQEIIERYQLAQELFIFFMKIKTLGFQKAYSSTSTIDKDLEKMQKMIRPYNKYPRFKLYYHYILFSKGCAKPNSNKQVISRHLNAYKKLHNQYPEIPIVFFERHYKERGHFYFLLKEASFYTVMNEHKKALKLIKEIVAFEEPNEVYLTKNYSYISNKFIIAICAGDYDFTLKVMEELKVFQEVSKVEDHSYPYECTLLDFYGQAFPYYTCSLEEINTWLSISFAYQKIQSIRYQALRQFVHFKIYIITEQWEKAQEIIDSAQSIPFYEISHQHFDFKAFSQKILNVVLEQNLDTLYEFRLHTKQEKKRLKQFISPSLWTMFPWAEQVCQYHEKKLKKQRSQ